MRPPRRIPLTWIAFRACAWQRERGTRRPHATHASSDWASRPARNRHCSSRVLPSRAVGSRLGGLSCAPVPWTSRRSLSRPCARARGSVPGAASCWRPYAWEPRRVRPPSQPRGTCPTTPLFWKPRRRGRQEVARGSSRWSAPAKLHVLRRCPWHAHAPSKISGWHGCPIHARYVGKRSPLTRACSNWMARRRSPGQPRSSRPAKRLCGAISLNAAASARRRGGPSKPPAPSSAST